MTNEVITTTAARVKAGGFWCEDATAITQAALDKDGLTWDEEVPVAWGFDAIGLANTVLSFGSVRPKFKPRADRVVIELMKYLYTMGMTLGQQIKPPFAMVNVGHWLGDPNRAVSRKSQHDMWQRQSPHITSPAGKAVANAMAILFSDEPNHLICIHAMKLLLFATMQLHGQDLATAAKAGIVHFLRLELMK